MTDPHRSSLADLTIDVMDPRDLDARHCLTAYFLELGSRFDAGFDPSKSISASDSEMTLPNGLFLVARGGGVVTGHPDPAP